MAIPRPISNDSGVASDLPIFVLMCCCTDGAICAVVLLY